MPQIAGDEIARFNFKPIRLIPLQQQFPHVSEPRQAPRPPLLQHMEVLVQDEFRVTSELLDAATQVDAVRPRGRNRARMPAHPPRALDENNTFRGLTEEFDECASQ